MSEASLRWWFVAPLDEDRHDGVGLARPIASDRERDLRDRHRMLDGIEIDDWLPQQYVLEGGGFGDYPREVRGYRLCSDRLRRALDAARAPQDRVQWLPAEVADEAGERLQYWVLNLLRPIAADFPGLASFDWGTMRERASDGTLDAFGVLPPPGFGMLTFVVSQRVRDSVTDAGCDVAFRPL